MQFSYFIIGLQIILPFVARAKHFVSSKMTTTWNGNAMTQTDMMEKDTVLVLDKDDNVIGSASKKESHVFKQEQARGILHRAFSVFLFDESTGEFLLQQRASTKITFPEVRRFLLFGRLFASYSTEVQQFRTCQRVASELQKQ
jgi:hypothetical protein